MQGFEKGLITGSRRQTKLGHGLSISGGGSRQGTKPLLSRMGVCGGAIEAEQFYLSHSRGAAKNFFERGQNISVFLPRVEHETTTIKAGVGMGRGYPL